MTSSRPYVILSAVSVVLLSSTFRFRDLAKWDVDYDDPLWREIAEFNEDKPLYRIRKFFRRK